MCVQVPTEARKGMALLELELQAAVAVGQKLNLGALDTLKYCSHLSVQNTAPICIFTISNV